MGRDQHPQEARLRDSDVTASFFVDLIELGVRGPVTDPCWMP